MRQWPQPSQTGLLVLVYVFCEETQSNIVLFMIMNLMPAYKYHLCYPRIKVVKLDLIFSIAQIYSFFNTTHVVEIILVESWNSLSRLWLVNLHITQITGEKVKDAKSVIATNIQFSLRKLWLQLLHAIIPLLSQKNSACQAYMSIRREVFQW